MIQYSNLGQFLFCHSDRFLLIVTYENTECEETGERLLRSCAILKTRENCEYNPTTFFSTTVFPIFYSVLKFPVSCTIQVFYFVNKIIDMKSRISLLDAFLNVHLYFKLHRGKKMWLYEQNLYMSNNIVLQFKTMLLHWTL